MSVVQPQVGPVSLGTVQELRRYPVKSMLGATADAIDVSSSGVDHDRVFALVDDGSGRIGSAKQPRLWRVLLQCTATWTGEEVRVRLPDGRQLAANDERAADVLTELVGRPVHMIDTRPPEAIIARPSPEDVMEHGEDADVPYVLLHLGADEPGGTFVDAAPVSLVTTSTLDQVGQEALRYRPNIVIRTAGSVPPFAENDWTGREIRVGPVRLRGLRPIVRCAIPTLEHGELPRALDAVRTLLTQNRIERPDGTVGPCLGAYAEVLEGGRIRSGDEVSLV